MRFPLLPALAPRRASWLLAALLLFAAPLAAQTIQGRVTDAKTGEALPFVNIGLVGKGIGTVADEQGRYALPFSTAHARDTVRVSSLGFRPRRLLLEELARQPQLQLTPEAIALQEVKVKAKGPYKRTHRLGFDKDKEGGTLSLSSNDLGTEIGSIIQLKRRPTLLLNANFNVAYNHAGPLTFRVNLYRLLPNGKPSDVKLVARDIIVTSAVQKGPITVDLAPYQLVLDEDFLLSLEWVDGPERARVSSALAFVAGLGFTDNDLYVRTTSQATWERAAVGALLAGMQPKLGFFVTVKD
ncbi:carboxypeptidase-like regulatory domain-containing protein [Hymenobacter sp. B81]|uniref:carboxypeptidase-like regulatory domain-containing protein n=1 Tax=Hymenobacter sp. B81 TaxID=3344878 RepID=UPI0037DCABAF